MDGTFLIKYRCPFLRSLYKIQDTQNRSLVWAIGSNICTLIFLFGVSFTTLQVEGGGYT